MTKDMKLVIVEYPKQYLSELPLVKINPTVERYSVVQSRLQQSDKSYPLYTTVASAINDDTPILLCSKKNEEGTIEECYVELSTFLLVELQSQQMKKAQTIIAELVQKYNAIENAINNGQLTRTQSSGLDITLYIADGTIVLSREEYSNMNNYRHSAYEQLAGCIEDYTYVFSVPVGDYNNIDEDIQQQLSEKYDIQLNERKQKYEFYKREFDIEYY